MSWRPSRGAFTVSKAEAALPPRYLGLTALLHASLTISSTPFSSELALSTTVMLKYDLRLKSHIATEHFCALLLVAYKIRGIRPFVLDPQDMKVEFGLSRDFARLAVSENLVKMIRDVFVNVNAERQKAALGALLCGVTEEIAEELFRGGNFEARIPTLISLLRLMAKPDFSSTSSDCSYPDRDTLSTFSYGFNQLKDVILWATVYHFLYRPDIYAELYAQFAEDFEFFGKPHLKMIEEIEQILPFKSIAPQLAGDYDNLLAYYHAYKRGASQKKDEEVPERIITNLPELAADTLALSIGRFSRLFSFSFDTVLSPEGHPTASLEVKGVLDGLKPTVKPAYTRAFEAAAKDLSQDLSGKNRTGM